MLRRLFQEPLIFINSLSNQLQATYPGLRGQMNMQNVGQKWSLRSPIILFQGWVSSVRRCICSMAVTTDDDSELVDIAAGRKTHKFVAKKGELHMQFALEERKDKIVKNGSRAG